MTSMKTARLIFTTAITAFLVSLLISSLFVYMKTEALTETRKSALIKTLSQAQIKDLGAFHWYDSPYIGGYWCEQGYMSELSTADALMVLKILNASNTVNVGQALKYVAYKQYDKDTGTGGFGAVFDGTSFHGCDLYSTYKVARVLNAYSSFDRINQTSLMNFIMKRYNDTIGSFQELVTEIDGQQWALSRFSMVFRSFNDNLAYGVPNIITTYAGVCTLKELDRLDLINVSKTFEWIMHCQAENGMFRPYPSASYMPMPSWSPLQSNPFEVDRYGTGIPYTFAAVSALEALGRLDAIPAEDRQKMKDYIVACQGSITGMISIHQDYDYRNPSFTYEATMILYHLDMLDEARNAASEIVNYFCEIQTLHLDDSWPVPYPGDYYDIHTAERYGLHFGDTGPPTDSYYAIAVFNATGNLHLLDQPTPRIQRTWLNLIELSALITALTTGILVGVLRMQKWRQKKALKPNLHEY